MEGATWTLGGAQGRSRVRAPVFKYVRRWKQAQDADFTWKDVASPSEGLLLKMKRYCLLEWMCRIGAYSSSNCISHMHLSLIPVASMCAECDENKQP